MLTSNGAAIERAHVRDLKNIRPFSIIVDSEFTETNKALNLLLESQNRSGDICSMVDKRPCARKRPLFVKVLSTRHSGRIFTKPLRGLVNILLLFTEIEKNNRFSIYTRSDLKKQSRHFQKETNERQFYWRLNSCLEKLQVVEAMRETCIYRLFKHGRSGLSFTKSSSQSSNWSFYIAQGIIFSKLQFAEHFYCSNKDLGLIWKKKLTEKMINNPRANYSPRF